MARWITARQPLGDQEQDEDDTESTHEFGEPMFGWLGRSLIIGCQRQEIRHAFLSFYGMTRLGRRSTQSGHSIRFGKVQVVIIPSVPTGSKLVRW